MDPTPPSSVQALELSVPSGDDVVRARLYVPARAEGPSGLVVWFHGGGWVQGSLESHDPGLRRLSASSAARVLAVDYRLAPEHRFPAGLDDAVAAFCWAVAHADQLGADPERIAIGGDSAGATLATVAALECARRAERPCLQVLCYPSLGPELMTESHHDFAEGFGLTADDMAYFYEQYLPAGQNHADPRVSPLLTPDLHEAPAAVVAIAGFDVLRDEGLAYVGLLESSGVDVELLDEPSLVHGFLRQGGMDAPRRAIERLGERTAEKLR